METAADKSVGEGTYRIKLDVEPHHAGWEVTENDDLESESSQPLVAGLSGGTVEIPDREGADFIVEAGSIKERSRRSLHHRGRSQVGSTGLSSTPSCRYHALQVCLSSIYHPVSRRRELRGGIRR